MPWDIGEIFQSLRFIYSKFWSIFIFLIIVFELWVQTFGRKGILTRRSPITPLIIFILLQSNNFA